MVGEIYTTAKDLVRREQSAGLRTRENTQATLATVTNSWSVYQNALWEWVWVRRDTNLVAFTVLGITFFRRTFGQMRWLWRRWFGPCPFSWEDGPRV